MVCCSHQSHCLRYVSRCNQIAALGYVSRTNQSVVFVLWFERCSSFLYPVWSLQSAFCTNRYPWHQYSLFLVTVIRTTHPIYHKIPVCELTRHFRYFRVNTLLSFCKKLDITYNVWSNPPTSKKTKNSCMHSMPMFVFLRGFIGK